MRKEKCSFFSDFVEANSDIQGKLFRAIKRLLKEKYKISFPGHNEVVLANELGKYFVQKISNIRLKWTMEPLRPIMTTKSLNAMTT